MRQVVNYRFILNVFGFLCIFAILAPGLSEAREGDDDSWWSSRRTRRSQPRATISTRSAISETSSASTGAITKSIRIPENTFFSLQPGGHQRFRSRTEFTGSVSWVPGERYAQVTTPGGQGKTYHVLARTLAVKSSKFADCYHGSSPVNRRTRSSWSALRGATERAANSTRIGRYTMAAGRTVSAIGGRFSKAIQDYALDRRVKCMIDRCKKRMSRTRGGLCLRNVREHGQNCGMIGGSGSIGASASRVGPRLKKEGFINLMEHPQYGELIKSRGIIGNSDIPVGSIMQYDGTNCGKSQRPRYCNLGKGHGHIEIKSSPNGYCYDRERTNVAGGAARITQPGVLEGRQGTTAHRKLKAVWVKADILKKIGL